MDVVREKKSTLNAMFVYVVFLACYLPHLSAVIMLTTNNWKISFLTAERVSLLLVFINSSLSPVVYCWRYRQIRGIVKNTVRKIFRINGDLTYR